MQTRVAHEAEEHMSDVGREVRRRREVQGWSQAKLAVEAGMAVSAVSQIENGHRRPSAGSLEKLSRAFGLEVGDLFPKASAPLFKELPSEASEQRRENEQDLGLALSILVEDCAQDGRELEDHFRSVANVAPVSAYPFIEKYFAVDTIFKQLESERQLPEELQEARGRLDEIALRVSKHAYQLLHPTDTDKTRSRFVKEVRARRRPKEERLEKEDTAAERKRVV
jgi:transcriptional regulator with XRE-family HTH domain